MEITFIPLKPLLIGRHPGLAQRSAPSNRSEPGLNPNKPHNLVPLSIPIGNPSIPTSTSLPNNRHRSRLGGFAVRPQARSRNGDETEEESGEADQEAEDQDRRSPSVGRRAGVEVLGMRRHVEVKVLRICEQTLEI